MENQSVIDYMNEHVSAVQALRDRIHAMTADHPVTEQDLDMLVQPAPEEILNDLAQIFRVAPSLNARLVNLYPTYSHRQMANVPINNPISAREAEIANATHEEPSMPGGQPFTMTFREPWVGGFQRREPVVFQQIEQFLFRAQESSSARIEDMTVQVSRHDYHEVMSYDNHNMMAFTHRVGQNLHEIMMNFMGVRIVFTLGPFTMFKVALN
jgi:hypothetical protein